MNSRDVSRREKQEEANVKEAMRFMKYSNAFDAAAYERNLF